MSRTKKTVESEEVAAKRLGLALGVPGRITRQHVRTWRSKNYDLADVDALRKSLWAQKRTPQWFIDSESARAESDHGDERIPPDELAYRLNLAKALKTEAEAEIKQIEAEAAKKKWITTDELEESGRQLGAILRGHLLPIPGNWAPILEGMNAANAEVRMREEIGKVIMEMHRLMSERGLPTDTLGAE